MVEIADFVVQGPVESEVVEAYRGRVPDELVEVWEQYGYGSFGEGFLRVIKFPDGAGWRQASVADFEVGSLPGGGGGAGGVAVR